MIRVRSKRGKPEENDGVSVTIPDQALSIPELIARHTQFQEIPIRDPIFDVPADEKITEDMFDTPDLTRLDKIEKEQLKLENSQDIEEIKEKLKLDDKEIKKLKAIKKKVTEAKKREAQKASQTSETRHVSGKANSDDKPLDP